MESNVVFGLAEWTAKSGCQSEMHLDEQIGLLSYGDTVLNTHSRIKFM